MINKVISAFYKVFNFYKYDFSENSFWCTKCLLEIVFIRVEIPLTVTMSFQFRGYLYNVFFCKLLIHYLTSKVFIFFQFYKVLYKNQPAC